MNISFVFGKLNTTSGISIIIIIISDFNINSKIYGTLSNIFLYRYKNIFTNNSKTIS